MRVRGGESEMPQVKLYWRAALLHSASVNRCYHGCPPVALMPSGVTNNNRTASSNQRSHDDPLEDSGTFLPPIL